MPIVEKTGSGRPILMIHGSPGDRGTWMSVAALTPPTAASWVVELPSHGRQPLREDGLAGFLADLSDALDEAYTAAAGPVVVAGLSVGAYLGLRLARDHADKVAAVVSCAGFSEIDAAGAAWRRQFAQQLTDGTVTPASFYGQWRDLLVAPTERRGDTEAILRRSMGDESVERMVAIALAAAEIGDPGAAVRHIEQPLVVLHGRGDPLLPVAEVEVVRKLSAHTDVHILETASHVITLSHPEAIAERVFAAGR